MTRANPRFFAAVDDEFAAELRERPRRNFAERVFSPHAGPHDEAAVCDELVAAADYFARPDKGAPHSADCCDQIPEDDGCIGEPDCPAIRMWREGLV